MLAKFDSNADGEMTMLVSFSDKSGELPTLAYVANIKYPSLWYIFGFERRLQLLWWFHHVLFRQHPGPPMHAECLFAFRISKDVDRVLRIGMHW